MIQTAIARAVSGKELDRELARASMEQILAGEASPAQIGALAVSLRMKGETPEEIAGMADAMRKRVAPLRTRRRPLLDTCGTGGDSAGTFNISTTVALVTASCGVAVAKHGNRAVSSRTGSADVLESLGVRIDLTPESAGRSLDLLGITFLFAPNYHTALRHAAGPRREIGGAHGVQRARPAHQPRRRHAPAARRLLGPAGPAGRRGAASSSAASVPGWSTAATVSTSSRSSTRTTSPRSRTARSASSSSTRRTTVWPRKDRADVAGERPR